MAWKVNEGSWKGVDLAGLCVAAAVQGDTTLLRRSPREGAGGPDRGLARRPSRNGSALIDLAKTLGGARLGQVKTITTTRMRLTLEDARDIGERIRPRDALHAPLAAGFLLGRRDRPDRDPAPGRPRPFLRERGRRVSAALQGRLAFSPHSPWAMNSRVRASIPDGTTRTAAAASSATSPIDRLGEGCRGSSETETSPSLC